MVDDNVVLVGKTDPRERNNQSCWVSGAGTSPEIFTKMTPPRGAEAITIRRNLRSVPFAANDDRGHPWEARVVSPIAAESLGKTRSIWCIRVCVCVYKCVYACACMGERVRERKRWSCKFDPRFPSIAYVRTSRNRLRDGWSVRSILRGIEATFQPLLSHGERNTWKFLCGTEAYLRRKQTSSRRNKLCLPQINFHVFSLTVYRHGYHGIYGCEEYIVYAEVLARERRSSGTMRKNMRNARPAMYPGRPLFRDVRQSVWKVYICFNYIHMRRKYIVLNWLLNLR